ncbi:hypothetical protein CFC21_005554 [Triticum aestivum]|uniref:EGF-like domain-containing protein n=2 Tax=Triticum aestivum TaxID=4565 RepID=A0A9R1D9W8_WHEAT|nr:hypothetical protein CFC21_005551 [Triticum aestivum]KAF6987963.1 hypothetical protein CFC21_005554 [Triticum aestivum]
MVSVGGEGGRPGSGEMNARCVTRGRADACSYSCGDVDVPFPFGIGPNGCYRPGFDLTCDRSSNPPRLFLDREVGVEKISLLDNTVRVLVDGATASMTSKSVGSSGGFDYFFTGREATPYSLSTNNNELILVGCNVQASLFGDGDDQATISGCTSFCPVNRSTGSTYASRQVPSGGSDRYCYGIGCCQARISISANNTPASWMITRIDENQETQGKILSPPVAMLIAAVGVVRPAAKWEVMEDLATWAADAKLQHPTTTATCHAEVARNICLSRHSHCKLGRRGYLCQCSNGYVGNPCKKEGCKGIYISVGVAIGAAVVLSFFIAF